MVINPKKKYTAILSTDIGDIVLELFADKTSVMVNNFIFLASEGFYDGTIFHRFISGYMSQSGDPTRTGAGSPSYRFADEFHPSQKHDKTGIISMANAGPGANGSQFFITHFPTPDLYIKHSIFGQVASGMDVLLCIPERDPMKVNSPAVRLHKVIIQEV
jgi:peptidyl-prolyl cis-trans isomerase B (cyclophilin B)